MRDGVVVRDDTAAGTVAGNGAGTAPGSLS
jgi:hypothetical protein